MEINKWKGMIDGKIKYRYKMNLMLFIQIAFVK